MCNDNEWQLQVHMVETRLRCQPDAAAFAHSLGHEHKSAVIFTQMMVKMIMKTDSPTAH